jgi:phosphoribosylglycinamide formyltransferase-1
MGSMQNKKIVFLCSGGGGNLRFIHYAIEHGWIPGASIVSVLTDRECQANQFAESVGIESQCIDFNDPDQCMLVNQLETLNPDLVITTVHKILRKPVVEKFSDRLINLHYSLLPAFDGLIGTQPVREAVSYGARFTGVTVHLVDESLDGGKPIVQVAIPLLPVEKNFDSLMDLVFRCGCIALMAAIDLQLSGGDPTYDERWEGLELEGRLCLFSDKVRYIHELQDECVWRTIGEW